MTNRHPDKCIEKGGEKLKENILGDGGGVWLSLKGASHVNIRK